MLDKRVRNLQKAGLSYNTISSTHTLIHNALNYAVYPAKLINSNSVDYIKVPKNSPRNVIKRTIITPERFKDLLKKFVRHATSYPAIVVVSYGNANKRSTWLNLV